MNDCDYMPLLESTAPELQQKYVFTKELRVKVYLVHNKRLVAALALVCRAKEKSRMVLGYRQLGLQLSGKVYS